MTISPQHRASNGTAGAGPSALRLALFAGAYNHVADGVSLTLNRLVAYLEGQGVPVRVVAPTVPNPPVHHAGTLLPAPSVPAPGRSDYRLTYSLSSDIEEALARFNPTLIQVATPDLLGLQALRLSKRWGLPRVASYHTHFSSYLKYYKLSLMEPALWGYLRWFYNQFQQVYVPSDSMMDVLQEQGFTSDLRLWARGINTETFHPEQRSMGWRRRHGIADDEVVVTFVSRLVWEKGLGTLADTLQTLERHDVPHRSVVVGDGPAYEALRTRLPRTIFTGYLSGDALGTAYASSDIFLFPSDTETFGNVILEAAASGLPAVCADATGSRSLVRDGTTGFLVPPGNTPAFAERLRTLILDGALRRQFSKAALERSTHYRWDRVLSRLHAHYHEAVGLPQPAPAPVSPALSVDH